MVKLSDSRKDALAIAKSLSAQGLQVFPARYKDKITLVEWKKFQGTDSSPMLEKWFKGRAHINFWVLTGRQSGFVVVDADSEKGDEWWRSQLGDEIFDATAASKTAKGTHYWFKIPEDWDSSKEIPSWACHPGKNDDIATFPSFDFRGDLMGVIVPPSIHESGARYEWLRPLDVALEAPTRMLDGSVRADAPQGTGDAGATTTGTGGTTRSLLSRLLASPPGGDGSGRNDWLAKVAGHYAKTYHQQQDLYEAHCTQANNSMGTPLDDKEFTKTVNSVWKGEHERNQHRAIDASCGFLATGNSHLLCQVVEKQGDDRVYNFVEYADFDLQAKGVMVDDTGKRTYLAEVVRKKRGGQGDVERFEIVLRAEVLGDDRSLRKFLASYACTIVPPDNMWPKAGSPGVRIQRYLESQHPPTMEIVPALGYCASADSSGHGAFIVHEGGITADGLQPVGTLTVRADPRLRSSGLASFDYGFDHNPVIARDILAEVMSFHHDEVTAVFGAWWAACLLKPQIEERTSLFPFMAIEAPSESGKTNGFFQMMLQLQGNTRGETQPTKAALRDMASAHKSGAVWVDDLDDPAYLMELLRAATSGGSLTKMGEDRETVKNTAIVSPIVISGEALGLGTQKALLDRALVLKATSPTSRMSVHNPYRPQWDDVLSVREQFPQGLHVLAGWYVQAALGFVEPTLLALKAARTSGSGRSADKVAVLRAGARLLDALLDQDGAWEGQGTTATRVEQWLVRERQIDTEGVATTNSHNALTLEVLPWALQVGNFPDKIQADDPKWFGRDTPIQVRNLSWVDGEALFGETTEVWFSPSGLAQAWERYKMGRIERRTHTEAAFKDQASALGSKSRRVKISQSGGRLAYYYQITGLDAISVVERAMGN